MHRPKKKLGFPPLPCMDITRDRDDRSSMFILFYFIFNEQIQCHIRMTHVQLSPPLPRFKSSGTQIRGYICSKGWWLLSLGGSLGTWMRDSIDDLKSEMAHILCNELPIAQSSRLQTPFSGMFKILTFQNLDFDTRVELNVFYHW